jgi:hypothetical protein
VTALSISQIKTKTLDSVFSVEEVSELLNLINNKDIKNNQINKDQSRFAPDKKNGRSRIDLNHYSIDYNVVPSNLLDKIISVAKLEYGKDVKIHNIYSTTYSKKFGMPHLAPHKDNSGSVFIIDYCLDGNIDWPIVVEGEEFLLKNNQALMTDVYNNLHWRNPIKFSDGDFLTMVYFLFYDPELDIKEKTVEEVYASYTEEDLKQRVLYNELLGEVKKQYDEEVGNDNNRNVK